MLYEFTTGLQLQKEEFDNLVFMNAPNWWKENLDAHEFLNDICSKPLNEVVVLIMKKPERVSTNKNPNNVFKNLQDIIAKKANGESERNPWFKSHLDLNKEFDFNLMPPIWIRNLSRNLGNNEPSERQKCPNGSYYIEDGNTRALVYALRVAMNVENFKPFPAIHATSWELASGILGYLPQKADVLENKGVFTYNKSLKESARLPMGITVDWYKGSSRQERN